jgi:hypothetical protein
LKPQAASFHDMVDRLTLHTLNNVLRTSTPFNSTLLTTPLFSLTDSYPSRSHGRLAATMPSSPVSKLQYQALYRPRLCAYQSQSQTDAASLGSTSCAAERERTTFTPFRTVHVMEIFSFQSSGSTERIDANVCANRKRTYDTSVRANCSSRPLAFVRLSRI